MRAQACETFSHCPGLMQEGGDEGEQVGDDAHTRFQAYCSEMASTAAWGGQLELNALAQASGHLKTQRALHGADNSILTAPLATFRQVCFCMPHAVAFMMVLLGAGAAAADPGVCGGSGSSGDGRQH